MVLDGFLGLLYCYVEVGRAEALRFYVAVYQQRNRLQIVVCVVVCLRKMPCDKGCLSVVIGVVFAENEWYIRVCLVLCLRLAQLLKLKNNTVSSVYVSSRLNFCVYIYY